MPKQAKKELYRRVGANLRLLREDAGYTLADLAAHLGVSYQQVQKYETGENAMPLSAVPILADLFGVSADVFFSEGETFPGGIEGDVDILGLCFTIASVHDPVLRTKIRRVVEVMAA